MQPLTRGVYTARLGQGPVDLAAARALRHLSFRAVRGLAGGAEGDRFDAACQHVLVQDQRSGDLVCCFRVLTLDSGAKLGASYAAQFYDLAPLHALPGPLLELGRFCLHPDHSDPDILRLAWAALTRLVDAAGGTMLFGCSSFDGADPGPHVAALAHLARHHLGPAALQPGVLAPETVSLRDLAPPTSPPRFPSLLRTYLGMGGWVSDHAVIDRDLNTLHVFTALPIAAIPATRARALRDLATQLPHATS